MFVLMYIRQEAVLSSRIEGTRSSLQDLLEAEAKLFKDRSQSEVYEVVNYVNAMRHGLKEINENEVSLAIPLIKEIHSRLLQNTRGTHLSPGELRTNQVWIGPSNCSIHQADFVPPPPHQVEQHLKDLVRFIKSDSELPPLLKVGLVHSQFETIHPFQDGNGRIGRLLITLMLCDDRMLSQPVLYLSKFFNRHRREYYDLLQSVRDEGKWENWLLFFLRAVVEVSRHAAFTATHILSMRDANRKVLNEKLGRSAALGHQVLDRLYALPIISVNEVQKITKTSYAAANSLVARLVNYGLLRETTNRSRNRLFSLYKYLELFDE